MRAVWLNLHRWVGLTLLAFLMLLGVTGSVLVFHQEIDAALNPDWFTVESRLGRASVDAQVARIEAAVPTHRVTYVRLRDEGFSTQLFMNRRPEAPHTAPEQIQGFADPHTGEILGWRDRHAASVDRRNVMRFLYDLHHSMRLGDGGFLFIGVVGVLWMLDHVAAIVLSFPKLKLWRRSFNVKPGASTHKTVYDGHRATGLWFLPVFLAVALSGISMNLNPQFRAVVEVFSPLSPYAGDDRPDMPQPLVNPIGYDRAIAAAAVALPDLSPGGGFYEPDKGHYGVEMRGTADLTWYGETTAIVDAGSGRVADVQTPQDRSAGDTFMAWQFPLHSGDIFGMPGRLIVLASGVLTAWLAGSGLWLYARRLGRSRVGLRSGTRTGAPVLAE